MSFCFPCFGRSSTATDSEREPLLPKYRTRHSDAEHPPVRQSKPTPSTVDKFLDVLAAFNAGKLPTLNQTACFVQILLHSDLLKLDAGVVASGHGPTSKEGRRVLGDIKGFLQAVLDFGLEKNADDLLQRLYYQLRQIDVEKGIASAIDAADKAARETENGAAKVEDYSSIESQIAFDSATFLCALRTLIESCFKSPSARFLLADLFSIVKDVVALAAADVERAARHVQQAAMEVQHQAQSKDDIIDKVTGASTDDMKEAGKEAADKIADATKQATHELKDDLTGLGNEASDKTKEKILQRVQEVLSRLQSDRASRGALRAILILARKYAQKILSAAYASETFVSDLAGQAQTAGDNTLNYPPQPYPPTATENNFMDAASDQLLQNVNDFLQRIAGGHKLDALLTSLGRVVRDLENAPLALNQEIEHIIAENEKGSEEPIITIPEPLVALQPGQAASAYAPETLGKGKAKKNRKARMRQKKAAARAAKISPAVSESQITASVSGESTPTVEVGTSHTRIQERRPHNPLRPYFSALGAYMDRVLDQPGWAASDEGRRSLEILFDDGVELLNVVGGGLLDARRESVQAPNGARDFSDDKVRREFKANLQNLINEAEMYIGAVQQDKATIGVLEAFSTLSTDFVGLVTEMSKKTTPSLGSAISGLGGWAAWIGWAIPRILRMLPAAAVPIPTVEVKTGKIEAALHALFIQGFARSGDTGARFDLVPDEVILTEWTEVRIDMLPGAGENVENTTAQNVQTTSRLRVHADGVRATVEDVGYYFKYKGALAHYEDEGLLSLDVGSEAPHTGIGADIELEFERESDSNELSEPSEPVIPGIVVRSASGDVLSAAPPHPAPPAPLFRVADVRVALKHLHFRLSHSKHWLLNTVLQPFAGPLVSRLCTHFLEERIRASLEVLATGLAAVVRDAEDRQARRFAQGDDEREIDGATRVADWWSALLAQGPALFGRPTTQTSCGMQNTEPTETHQTSTTATSRGIIHTDVTTTVAEPRGTPAMVYNTFTREIEPVDLEARGIGMEPEVVQEEETVVAVGAGPQLFPGKGGPYGSDQTDNRRGIDDVVKDIGAAAADRVQEGAAQVADIQQDYRKKLKKEEHHTDTWKSDAFDF